VIEHAAEIPHAVRDADKMDRHLEGDLLVGPDLIQIEMEDLGRPERVALHLANQRLTGARPSITTSRIVVRR